MFGLKKDIKAIDLKLKLFLKLINYAETCFQPGSVWVAVVFSPEGGKSHPGS